MAGPGIRSWEIARAMAANHLVTLISPHPVDAHPDNVSCGSYTWGDADSLAPWLRDADVILANGFLLEGHPELAEVACPLVLDLYDPTILENLELYRNAPEAQRTARHRQDHLTLSRQLRAGDFFLCATERQRDLYLGALMAQGMITPALVDADPQLRQLIDVLPSGLPAEPPIKQHPALRGIIDGIEADDPIVLWTGGLWDWMDPLTLIAAMPKVVPHHPNVRLVFLAGQHPGMSHQMRMPVEARMQAASSGMLNRHIFFYDTWVPYAQRANVLLEATIAVALHRRHLEMRYAAIRSRVLDHLWAALPSIVSDGDPAASLIEEAGAGLVVPPEDPDALADAINQLLANVDLRAKQSEAARELARRFTWDRVVEPLVRFCQNPRRIRPVKSPTEASADQSSHPGPNAHDALTEREALLEACRNAAIGVQEKTWRLREQPLGPGKLNHLRRVLIDQIVRPFIAPILEQQQAYNTAVLRSMYAMNETSDYRNNRLAEIATRTQSLEQFSQAITAHVHALEAFIRRVERDMYEKVLNPLYRDVVVLHERTMEHHARIERLKENDMRTRQQFYDMAEQLAGLEDADSLLAALLRGSEDGKIAMLPMSSDVFEFPHPSAGAAPSPPSPSPSGESLPTPPSSSSRPSSAAPPMSAAGERPRSRPRGKRQSATRKKLSERTNS